MALVQPIPTTKLVVWVVKSLTKITLLPEYLHKVSHSVPYNGSLPIENNIGPADIAKCFENRVNLVTNHFPQRERREFDNVGFSEEIIGSRDTSNATRAGLSQTNSSSKIFLTIFLF